MISYIGIISNTEHNTTTSITIRIITKLIETFFIKSSTSLFKISIITFHTPSYAYRKLSKSLINNPLEGTS
jgi:hypothetical protein